MDQVSREEWIRRRAHEIWEREGKPDGQHDQHWRRATAEYDAHEGLAAGAASTAGDLTSSPQGTTNQPVGRDATGSTPLEAVETKRDIDGESLSGRF